MHVEEPGTGESSKSASAGLSRHLPVLLGPENGITIEDVEEIVNRAMAMDIADPQTKIYLNKINELLRELELPRYSCANVRVGDEAAKQPQVEVVEETPCLTLEESLQATAGLFQMRTGKDSDQELTKKNVPRLCQQWMECCADILAGPSEKLPPLREVNHMIPLINKAKKYQYYTPKCPNLMKPQLLEKVKQYQRLGWWERQTATQAVPMLCVPKKDGSLRTTIDC